MRQPHHPPGDIVDRATLEAPKGIAPLTAVRRVAGEGVPGECEAAAQAGVAAVPAGRRPAVAQSCSCWDALGESRNDIAAAVSAASPWGKPY